MTDSEKTPKKTQRIIVAKEKHETRYLDASTDEAWARSALALLTERFNEGYWYYDPYADMHEFSVKHRKEREELLSMSEEAIAALPEGLREDVLAKVKTAKRDKAEDDKARSQYLEIKKVVESKDLSWQGVGQRWAKPNAWALLMARTEYEYERVGLREVVLPDIEVPSL